MKFILNVATGYRVLLGFHGQDRHFDFVNEDLDLRSVLSNVMASSSFILSLGETSVVTIPDELP